MQQPGIQIKASSFSSCGAVWLHHDFNRRLNSKLFSHISSLIPGTHIYIHSRWDKIFTHILIFKWKYQKRIEFNHQFMCAACQRNSRVCLNKRMQRCIWQLECNKRRQLMINIVKSSFQNVTFCWAQHQQFNY